MSGPMVADPNDPKVRLIERAAQVIVDSKAEPHTAPAHWAGALYEAGLLREPIAVLDMVEEVDQAEERPAALAGAGLGAAERAALITAANAAWHGGAVTVDRMVGALEEVVERILADRLAAADRDAGLRERVDAWDEGARAGERYERAKWYWQGRNTEAMIVAGMPPERPERTPNPYRAALDAS